MREVALQNGGAGRRIILIVVAIITAVWVTSLAKSDGPTDDSTDDTGADDESSPPADEDPGGPSLEGMVLNMTDLPSHRNLSSPYCSHYQGIWPGNRSAMGGRGFEDVVTADDELTLISQVFVYNTMEEAGEAMNEIKDLSIGLRENLTWDQVGDASVTGDYKYSSYLLGKAIAFQQDQYVCATLYHAYHGESGDISGDMMLEMANLQLNKLR